MPDQKTSHAELNTVLEAAKQKVKVGGLYSHYKKPEQVYRVLEIAFCEWDETICVIYQQLNTEYPLTWIRKLEGDGGWLTPGNLNGQSVPRFTEVTDQVE